jgi:hypothetical protein
VYATRRSGADADLLESEGNELTLVAPIITAVSALLLARERDASGWLAVLFRVDLIALA